MMKRISLEQFLRDNYNMTMSDYMNLTDEKRIQDILDAYDSVRSYPDKK